ncbi:MULTISPECIES: ABC transporter substrate-binding protein [Pseudomonadaceae]|jgi:polar amino acid transport system substrate-binding protein|uniref:ABC transporter substrate-binding protein n=1 Tax=Pseudomonadaceae TaxID=135621 RepID=UPI00061800D1|nr:MULTISPECIES: ABC transporter substrate-binding protein [Pseudomonadaceae]MBU0950355.1 PAAT family amino acid ABC transporter substrate-binding protein [Gammaproteobacteria bacterium]HBM09775.1 PAAT family amino acid ABC transporter substrate-binding protein [Pseudomonas sp.]KJJ64353.1 PAAT family amino acid ABC transporter substrate-binding protein [Pseudomonas sp. 10B238]MBK3796521.1 PAAT family amino acid ABC transporter substrate-binding protein [Stutzerimonas stutzeri]MBK3877024.1 PAAT|tara:strand:- start:4806 stop:5567 length:762 start_codon:yes stop_codon:yes gene_type:complete
MHRFVLLLTFVLLPSICGAQQRVEVWTYHFSPPFILEDGEGLSRAFVDLLNNDAANNQRFRFELVKLPRKRVDIRLARERPGVLLWATPNFFTAEQAANGKWSGPLLIDQQDFVSLPDAPFEYENPESLHNLVLGGVLGHRYEGLEADIASGAIKRQNAQGDLQNIEKLLSGRIGTLLIPRSTLLYYRKEKKLQDLYVSNTPLYQFTRHLWVADALGQAATQYLARFVENLPENPEWQILLFHYGLQPIATAQ